MDSKLKKRNIIWIMLFVAFFGISMGLWENYKIIWLEGTGFSILNISTILSISLIVGGVFAVVVNVCFRKLDPKYVIQYCILLKTNSMILLIFLFQKNVSVAIVYILFIFDGVAGSLVFNAIYPFITKYQKSDKMYSVFKITDYTTRDVGLGVAMFVISFITANYLEYNIILIIATVLSLFCVLISLMFAKGDKTVSPKFKFKGIFEKKSVRLYYLYAFISPIAYDSVMSFQVIILRDFALLSMNWVSIFLLIAGVAGDIFAVVALYKLTPKNDYLTVICKFGARFLVYLLMSIIATPTMAIIALFVVLFFSRAYEDVTDGKFINVVKQENRFAHSNIRYLFSRTGHALGTFISGLLIICGMRYLFIVGAILVLTQSILLCIGLYYLKKDEKKMLIASSKSFQKKFVFKKELDNSLQIKKKFKLRKY